MLIYFLALLVLCALLVALFYHSSNTLQQTNYTIKGRVNRRIVQVSDLHGREFGENNTKLLKLVAAAKPDFIAITGDLISRSNFNKQQMLDFAKTLCKIAPVYFVSGNHEHGTGDFESIIQGLTTAGVTVLNDAFVELEDVVIVGIDEPKGSGAEVLTKLPFGKYRILLNHYPHNPEKFSANADLMLSGHAHGGQFIFPLIGGIFAPNQGLFPKYYQGIHQIDDMQLIISRGLGNTVIPSRLFNCPELVVIDIIAD